MSKKQRGFNSVVKQAQKMQLQISRVQEEMADREIEASVGGGAVLAVVNGRQKLVRLSINPEAVDPEDVESLEDLIMSAINLANENASKMIQTEVNRITGGLHIPGIF